MFNRIPAPLRFIMASIFIGVLFAIATRSAVVAILVGALFAIAIHRR
jgi:uncharacterized membrane protein